MIYRMKIEYKNIFQFGKGKKLLNILFNSYHINLSFLMYLWI